MKSRLRNGEKLYGSFVTNPGWGGYIEILKYHGYDCVLIETEHAPMSYDKMEELVRTARLSGIHPIIRVNDLEYSLVARAMDMGCTSIMVPRLETAEQVRNVVKFVKYPPIGERGAGGYMTLFESDKRKYLNDANEEGIIIAQIESQKGINNLDEILQVPHVDVIFIGPFDLTVDLGIPGQTQHPSVIAAIERVIAKCKAKGTAVGIHLGNMQELKYWSERGITLLSLASDISALYTKAKENIDIVKGVKG